MMAALPTPKPTMIDPNTRISIDGVNPIIRHPTVKKMSAKSIVGFLPYLSAMGPPNSDPMAAPARVDETMISVSWSVIFSKLSSRYSFAPPITLVL